MKMCPWSAKQTSFEDEIYFDHVSRCGIKKLNSLHWRPESPIWSIGASRGRRVLLGFYAREWQDEQLRLIAYEFFVILGLLGTIDYDGRRLRHESMND